MNFNSNSQSQSAKGRLNSGSALTEMLIIMPLVPVLFHGLRMVSENLQRSVVRHRHQLEAELNPAIVPPHLRDTWPWPDSTQTHPSEKNTSKPSRFSAAFAELTCPAAEPTPDYTSSPHSTLPPRPLLQRLEEQRLRSISAQRSVCLAEAVLRWGVQNAPPLLLATEALPSDTVRERALEPLCPTLVRSSQFLRQAVVGEFFSVSWKGNEIRRTRNLSSAKACP